MEQLPPTLPGATFVSKLGSGGFADVYLYQQQVPLRQVAVKVVRPDARYEYRRTFEAEANLMASMSSHPSIVSVFGAGETDDGRAYLVMEYCPPPNMRRRAAAEPLSVERALQVGIMIGGAVETLHRAGIIHRDIKPANILVTQFNHPVLTDFGIAVSRNMGGEAVGLSVPWGSPEQLTGQEATTSSDTYSLTATIWTLLTGRAPFEQQGGDNSDVAMINRVLNSELPPTGRADVPPQLERVLAIGMAKLPQQRYRSVLDFLHTLQQIQTDLHHNVTPLDVLETVASEADEDGGDETRVRAVRTVTEPATKTAPTQAFGSRPAPEAGRQAPPPERSGGGTRRLGVIVGGLVAALVVGVAAWAVVSGGGGTVKPVETSQGPIDPLPSLTNVADVTDLAGTEQGDNVVFTWAYDEANVTFLYREFRPDGNEPAVRYRETTDKTVTIARHESGQTCLEVLVRTSSGQSSTGARKCVG